MKFVRRKTSRVHQIGAALAAMTLVVAACGGDDSDGDATQLVTFATGSTGGTYFPLGGAMAGVWNDNIDNVRVGTQSSGASAENLRLLVGGEVEIMMAVNGVAENALATGVVGDDDLDIEGIQVLGNVYGEVTQIIARADSGITSVEEMAGARIQIGPPGSGTEISARNILETAGVDPDNDIQVFQDTFGDALDSLRDGQTDVAFAILALPHGGTFDAANSVDMNFISVEGSLLDTLLGGDATLSPLEVAPGMYPGQDQGVTWVTNWATLYAMDDLDDDVAYDLVRVLYENAEDTTNAHATGSQIQLDTALDGRIDIPIHPGAERYYDEQGALD